MFDFGCLGQLILWNKRFLCAVGISVVIRAWRMFIRGTEVFHLEEQWRLANGDNT